MAAYFTNPTQASSVQIDQTAFEMVAYFALRQQMLFDAMADVKPTNESMPGSTVSFTQFTELAAKTSTLTETDEFNGVAMADAAVTVALAEYGNYVSTTAFLRAVNFIDIDTVAANLIGYNAGISIDTVVQAILFGGSNVIYPHTNRAGTLAGDTLTSSRIRQMVAQLRSAASMPTDGTVYRGFIHPDVSYDLRSETNVAAAGLRELTGYLSDEMIRFGVVGIVEGALVVETPRALVVVDGGSGGTVDVYGNIVVGKQALAKVWSKKDGNGPMPQIIVAPPTDALNRFHRLGWHWIGGYGRFREASIRRFESSSSLATNV